MKRFSIVLIIAILSFAVQQGAAQPLALASAHSTASFKKVKQDKGITVYERWFDVQGEGRQTRELKASFMLNASHTKALATLQDCAGAKEWMQSTIQVKAIEGAGSDNWLMYIRYNLPWPLNDQDCLMRYQVVKKGGHTLVHYRSVEDSRMPPQEGIKRLWGIEGIWKFQPAGENQARVTYSILHLQETSFPRWLIDPIVRDNLMDTMVAFREKVGG